MPSRLATPGAARTIPAQLEALLQGLSRMSALPIVAVQIVEAASNDTVDDRRLLTLVEREPVLAARLLKISNSSYYGQRQQVDSISRAIALLGRSTVASIALTVLVARQFKAYPTRGTFERERLWTHSSAVASVCRVLSKELGRGDAEQAYLAGLLHDFGLLVIDQQLNRHVPRILRALERTQSMSEAVASVVTFTPCELGAYIARKSLMPEPLALAIEFQERPEACPEDSPLAHLVNVADYLVCRSGAGVIRELRPTPPSDATFALLGLTPDVVRNTWPHVEAAIAGAQELANL